MINREPLTWAMPVNFEPPAARGGCTDYEESDGSYRPAITTGTIMDARLRSTSNGTTTQQQPRPAKRPWWIIIVVGAALLAWYLIRKKD